MAPAPHRVNNHVIDSKACSIVSCNFSENWVLRDLTERDFGVDKIAERFQNGYATSEILMLQIKGTAAEIDENNPRFSLETKTLIYAEMFSVPFLLIYCSVKQPQKCYYLWLQEYIRVRLNYDNPNWRNQDTNTVYFPSKNILNTLEAEEHLTYISQFPKYQASWVGYYLSLNDLCYNVPSIFDWDIMSKEDVDSIIRPIIQKLEKAQKKIGQIPRRFIPEEFERVIEIGNIILSKNSMPNCREFMKFIGSCDAIQTSVAIIADRFDDEYLRLLYDTEGTADY